MKHMLLILATLCSAPALAQSLVPVINNADIDDSGSRYQGNLSVNQAAGDKQQQVNARASPSGRKRTPAHRSGNGSTRRLTLRWMPAQPFKATHSATAVAHWVSTRAPVPIPSKPMP